MGDDVLDAIIFMQQYYKTMNPTARCLKLPTLKIIRSGIMLYLMSSSSSLTINDATHLGNALQRLRESRTNLTEHRYRNSSPSTSSSPTPSPRSPAGCSGSHRLGYLIVLTFEELMNKEIQFYTDRFPNMLWLNYFASG